jgi:hypothetical protein
MLPPNPMGVLFGVKVPLTASLVCSSAIAICSALCEVMLAKHYLQAVDHTIKYGGANYIFWLATATKPILAAPKLYTEILPLFKMKC